MTIVGESCRWMERFQVTKAGGVVASLPCHHGIASRLAKLGSMNGGADQAGRPARTRYDGLTPLLLSGKFRPSVKPRW